jgi:hypothetical protein
MHIKLTFILNIHCKLNQKIPLEFNILYNFELLRKMLSKLKLYKTYKYTIEYFLNKKSSFNNLWVEEINTFYKIKIFEGKLVSNILYNIVRKECY